MTARQTAYEVVRRTFESGAYADRAFDAIAAGLDPRGRRQAMRLAFGAVQRMRTVDHAMEELAGRRPGRLQAELRNALRVAGYEVLFSDSVPARAAVNEGVELAKTVAGARVAGLANAILRRIADAGSAWVDQLPPGLRYSYPDWVIEEWTAMLGEEEAARLAEAQNEPPELAVRVNTLKAAGEVDLGVPVGLDPELPEAMVIEGPFDVAASAAFREGLIWPQSRASMLPARTLMPEPGMRVLDLCAAPGGKTGHMAALMENRGELVAVERHPGRASQLQETLDRFGVTCARVEVADALDVREDGFDRILLDPPCSGLGVLAGRPDARWRRTLEGAQEVAGLQRRLLDHARGLLAPGGRLVYSVCTVRRHEGEEIIPGGRQTLPHLDRTDGFYIATSE